MADVIYIADPGFAVSRPAHLMHSQVTTLEGRIVARRSPASAQNEESAEESAVGSVDSGAAEFAAVSHAAEVLHLGHVRSLLAATTDGHVTITTRTSHGEEPLLASCVGQGLGEALAGVQTAQDVASG